MTESTIVTHLNPLIGHTPIETIQNVSEALSALIVLMAPVHSDLCRLLSPIQSAIEHAASEQEAVE